MISDKLLKAKLLEDEVIVSELPTQNMTVLENAASVMAAYQNANKWLDILKEELLMTHSSVFFSNYVHNLAHSMPVRFDKFGDILHTADIRIPYPATAYIPTIPEDIDGIIGCIFDILGGISESLRTFIKNTQDTEYHAMSCSVEELLVDIESEYPALYRMSRAYKHCGDVISFDKWVNHYIQSQNSLLG